MAFKPIHKQINVDLPEYLGGRINVDEGLVEVLRAIWSAAIPTYYSCQGGKYMDDFGPGFREAYGNGPQDMSGYVIVKRRDETRVRNILENYGLVLHVVEFIEARNEQRVCIRFKAVCAHDYVPILNGTVLWCPECDDRKEFEVAEMIT